MSDSTIPAAKAALITLFEAASGLDGVDIRWGGPTKESDFSDEMIYLGNVEQQEEDRGFGSTTEDYTIEVVALIVQQGNDERATEERLWAVRQEIKDSIADDDTLGGVLNETGARVERTRQDNEPAPNGWFARARIDVRCRSVLTD